MTFGLAWLLLLRDTERWRAAYVTRIPGYATAGATPETARSLLAAASEPQGMAWKPFRDRITQCTLDQYYIEPEMLRSKVR